LRKELSSVSFFCLKYLVDIIFFSNFLDVSLLYSVDIH
jgi:hypothetical protein